MSETVDLDSFREEVRSFLAANLPPETARRVKSGYYVSRDEIMDWHRALAARGWAVQNWPVELGGTGWSLMQKYIFDEEAAKAGAPLIPGAGINMVGSLLINFGSDEQKERFLPAIRSGDAIWCQAWSEAGAGSDLANVRCRAVRDGDDYVVDGSKLWASFAHRSGWCMLLVRTSSEGRKQDGITVLLVDMKTPGMTVRPIVSLDGMHSLNEIIFDGARVPVSNRVGEEGRGWPMMRGIVLDHERLSAAGINKAKSYLERLYAIARNPGEGRTSLLERPHFRRRLAWLEIRLRALHTLNLEILTTPRDAWGTIPSVLKLRGTSLQQDILEMISEAAGAYGIAFNPDAMRNGWGDEAPIGPEYATATTPNFFYTRHLTISGGASEIHRNMIAKSALG